MKNELWKPIPDFPNYLASSEGRIAKVLKGSQWEQGGERYRRTYISALKKTLLTHRLIALAFLGPCPDGMVVNHKNGNYNR